MAATSIADLIVTIEANQEKFHASVEKMHGELLSFQSVAAEASRRIERLLEFDLVVRGAEKFAEFLKGGAEGAEQLVHLAQKAGVTVEEMSRLSFAARQSGLDSQALGQSIGILSKGMEQAQAGTGKAAAAFAALHVGVTDASGQLRSSVEVMKDVAERFARMEDGAGKTALAMLIFGRAGADMVPMLNRGRDGIADLMAESDRLGKTMSTEVALGAKEFNENLLRLEGGSKLLAAAVAADVAPAFTRLINSFSEGSEKGALMREMSADLATVLRGAAWAGLALYGSMGVVSKSIVQMADITKHVAKGEFPTMAGLDAADRKMTDFFEHVRKMQRELFKPAAGQASDAFDLASKGLIPPKEKAPLIAGTEGVTDQERAVQRLNKEIASLNEKTLAAGLDSGKALEMSVYFGKWAEELRLSGAAADELRPKLLAAAQAFGAAEEQVKVAKDGAAAYEKLAAGAGQMEASLAKLQGATELERTYQSLSNGELAKEIVLAEAAGRNTAELTARYLAAAKAKDEQRAADDGAAEALRRQNEAIAEAKNLLTSHAGPLERYEQQLKKIEDAHNQGALNAREYGLALEYAHKDFVKAGGGGFADGYVHQLGLMDAATSNFARKAGVEFGTLTNGLMDGFAQATARGIVFGEDVGNTLKSVAAEGIATLIAGLIKMGAQMVLNAAVGQAAAAATMAAGVAQAGAMSAAWAPAAAGAALATLGANAIPASAALAETYALATTLSIGAVALEKGGPLAAGQLALVGEKGPELLRMDSPSHVFDASHTRSLLSGGAVAARPQLIVNNNAPGVEVVPQEMTEGRVVLLIQKHTPRVMQRELGDHSSRSRKTLGQSTTAGPRRT